MLSFRGGVSVADVCEMARSGKQGEIVHHIAELAGEIHEVYLDWESGIGKL